MTPWAEEVDPGNVLPEHPRPQFRRNPWMNLNGLWEYAVVPREQQRVDSYPGRILVPFCIESALSGVKKPLHPDERLWYRRYFHIPEDWSGMNIRLNFGAVDWEATVWVNGVEIGTHRGGDLPFSFDITKHVRKTDNELVVSVWDPTDTHSQQRGKQVLKPKPIFYSACSGIWQTVWLEPVPDPWITGLKVTPDVDRERLVLNLSVSSDSPVEVETEVFDEETKVTGIRGFSGSDLILELPEPKLWRPESPFLYDLKVRTLGGGKPGDEVASYFGMRKFSTGVDAQGVPRLMLNNRPIFHHGLLDQGYWPDGLYTAPTDKALRYDVEITKKLGFNMIRKHIKVEPARWYYHCDRLGIIVWQDMVNGGKLSVGAPGTLRGMLDRLHRDDTTPGHFKKAFREDRESRERFERELREMIDTLYNVPSIGVWVPFNEAWGQFDAARIGRWVRELDPSRTVDHASGWIDQGGGDLKSLHIYFFRLRTPRKRDKRVLVLSEYGGYTMKLPGHVWNEKKVFSYKRCKSREELTDAYVSLMEDQLLPLIPSGFSAAVYTQITDVEIEINGLLTYDRRIVKLDEEKITALNKRLSGILERG
jgi:beta-galactosidase/beta-glucuronidase